MNTPTTDTSPLAGTVPVWMVRDLVANGLAPATDTLTIYRDTTGLQLWHIEAACEPDAVATLATYGDLTRGGIRTPSGDVITGCAVCSLRMVMPGYTDADAAAVRYIDMLRTLLDLCTSTAPGFTWTASVAHAATARNLHLAGPDITWGNADVGAKVTAARARVAELVTELETSEAYQHALNRHAVAAVVAYRAETDIDKVLRQTSSNTAVLGLLPVVPFDIENVLPDEAGEEYLDAHADQFGPRLLEHHTWVWSEPGASNGLGLANLIATEDPRLFRVPTWLAYHLLRGQYAVLGEDRGYTTAEVLYAVQAASTPAEVDNDLLDAVRTAVRS